MYTAKINNKEFEISFDNKERKSGFISGIPFNIDVSKKDNKTFHIISNNKSYNINIISENKEEKTISIKINNNTHIIEVSSELDKVLKTLGIQNQKTKKNTDLKAPMPGLVTEILVNIGDNIKEGDNILVLEAMKMENNLKAEQNAIIKDIIIEKGSSVEKNQILVTFE